MIKKNMRFFYIGLIVLGIALICFLLFNLNLLNFQLKQARFLLAETEVAQVQLRKDKSSILKDNEKLQADSLAYVVLNNELQKEKESLQVKIQEIQKAIDTQKQELAVVQQNFTQMQKLSQEKNSAQQALVKERDQMRIDLKFLEDSINRERGIYHYNLAVAYTKAGIVNKAAQEYNESLRYDSKNAEAHYNLALLYKNLGNDPAKSLMHFQSYLALKPDAADAQEVSNFIYQLLELSNRKQPTL